LNIHGQYYRSIWLDEENSAVVCIFNQLLLPFKTEILKLKSTTEVITAIKTMQLRGAPLIGAAGAFAVYLAVLEHHSELINDQFAGFSLKINEINNARPTAVNLRWAVKRVTDILLREGDKSLWSSIAKTEALKITNEDAEMSRQIGVHGLNLIREISQQKKGAPVNILTHCNAGWLATIDYGTATAPIYEAYNSDLKIHVWVDETRPRSQGARLTAFELAQAGIPHTVIADNTGGHLMQHALVDICIVGCDRATSDGDAANKIGTYLKALAAKDNNIPFYVALPSSTFDWQIADGVKNIPIEERDGGEVKYTEGWLDGQLVQVLSSNSDSPVLNYGFDVTPARLISGFITERGICSAEKSALAAMFPDLIKNSGN